MLRVFVIIILFGIYNIAGAVEKNLLNQSIGKSHFLLNSACGFQLPPKLVHSSISAESSLIHFDSSEYYVINFSFKLPLLEKVIDAKINFSCLNPSSQGRRAPELGRRHYKTIAEMIGHEDSGGRYARNIAWEQAYTGIGWNGRIAYIDTIFGDGQSTSLNTYILCSDDLTKSCIDFSLDEQTILSCEDQKKILEILSNVQYQHPLEPVVLSH